MRTYPGVWVLLFCVLRTGVTQDGESLASSFFSGKLTISPKKMNNSRLKSSRLWPETIFFILLWNLWTAFTLQYNLILQIGCIFNGVSWNKSF